MTRERRANYVIVEGESDASRLVIRDAGPWDKYQTITNAAEIVVEELARAGLLDDGRELIYYDSEGYPDEIVHLHGRFVGFLPHRPE